MKNPGNIDPGGVQVLLCDLQPTIVAGFAMEVVVPHAVTGAIDAGYDV